MVFTKSLLIKALGGVAGVSGTTVGVLAGTGVFDRKETNTPAKASTAPVDPEIPSGAAKPKEGVTSNQVTTGDGTDTNHQDAGNREGTEPSNSRVDDALPGSQELNTSSEDVGGAGSPGVVVPPGSSSPGNNSGVPESQDSKGEGNESVDSTKPGVSGEVDNKAGEGATEQQSKQAGQTGDSPQQEDSGLPKDGSKGQDGDEHRSDSTSEIPAPGTPGNPEPGASGGDPKSQPSATPTDRTEDNTNDKNGKGISQEENISGGHETQQPVTGSQDGQGGEVDSPTNPQGDQSQRIDDGQGNVGGGIQQSDSTLQTASPGAPASTDDGNNGGSSLPNAGATPGAADAQNPGTGSNGASGSEPSNELSNGTTGGSSRSPDSSTTDSSSQSKEGKINTKLVELGLPNDKCNFSSGNTSTTCSISKDELDKVNFEDSSGSVEKGQITGLVGNVQLKIEILSKNKKTAYGLNDDSEGEVESDVTKDLLFTFSGFNNGITLTDDSITLYPNTNPEFKVEGNALKLMWDVTGELSKKAGLKNDNGTYSLGESIKYSENNDAVIKTLNPTSTTVKVHVQGGEKNFNQGEKITFSANVTSSRGSDSLKAGNYEIKYKDGDNGGWYLSLVEPKVTQPTGQLTQ